jgi:hypothetical protein
MARRDILLRLSKAQAEAMQTAVKERISSLGLIAPLTAAYDAELQTLHIANMKLTKVLERHAEKVTPPAPRFADVGCSSCGQSFGPGDSGFSHCEHHKGLKGYDR